MEVMNDEISPEPKVTQAADSNPNDDRLLCMVTTCLYKYRLCVYKYNVMFIYSHINVHVRIIMCLWELNFY